MKLDKSLQIDRKNWTAALGIEGEADKDLTAQLDAAETELLQAVKPHGIYRVVASSDIVLKGTAIKKHLENCHEIVIMGVTLGIEVDRLIRNSQVRDMAKAVLLDYGASTLVEQICDSFQRKIKDEVGLFMTGRYSPGYGDLPVETQRELLNILDAPRKIGLTVTRDCTMVPRKSVTAILGVSRQPVNGYLATCNECTIKETCAYRTKGENCVSKPGF